LRRRDAWHTAADVSHSDFTVPGYTYGQAAHEHSDAPGFDLSWGASEWGMGCGGGAVLAGGGSWEENDYACAPSLKERRLLLAAAHDIVSKESSQIHVLG
jgi:hypothetical protein